MVPQVLQLAHLVEDHRVAEVQVRRRGVESRLHAQRPALGELAREVLLEDQLVRAPPDDLEVFSLTH